MDMNPNGNENLFQQQEEYPQAAEAAGPEVPKKRNRHAGRIARYALLMVFCTACGVGGGYLGSMLNNKGGGPVLYQAATGLSSGNETDGASGSLTVQQIVAAVQGSVVEVTTEKMTTGSFLGQQVVSGAGSGVLISSDGYLITNNHVIENATNIKVRLSDGTEYPATLVGTDSKTDIAVLKIDATGLTPAILGDSDSLQVGEFALAIGNPLGSLGGTVTDGIISALDRDITVNGETMNLLQTNAAVNPGNSGGGLFNSRGELIGIINAKSSGSDVEGLGFAVPINTAKKVAEELINNGYVSGRPALGITALEVSSADRAMMYGVSRLGVYVNSVTGGTDAEKQGLQAGDYIVSIDGTAVSSLSDISAILSEHQVGDKVEVQIIRGERTLHLNIALSDKQQLAQNNNG